MCWGLATDDRSMRRGAALYLSVRRPSARLWCVRRNGPFFYLASRSDSCGLEPAHNGWRRGLL